MAIEKRIRNSTVEFLLFTSTDDGASIEARYENETIWLTQKLMAELFGTTQQNISLHLKTIYAEGELDEQATHKDFLLVQTEAARRVSRIRGTSGSNQGVRAALRPHSNGLRGMTIQCGGATIRNFRRVQLSGISG